jgi:hypothetical protein
MVVPNAIRIGVIGITWTDNAVPIIPITINKDHMIISLLDGFIFIILQTLII